MDKKSISTGIWRLNEELLQIREELIENGGELTEELQVRLENMDIASANLVDGIHQMSASVKADEAAINEEIKRLQGLKKARANAIDSLKRFMLGYMLNNDIKVIEGSLCSATIQKGRESVEMCESVELEPYQNQIDAAQESVPPFVKIKAEVSKTELKKWIESGNPVVAASIVRNPSLKIG